MGEGIYMTDDYVLLPSDVNKGTEVQKSKDWEDAIKDAKKHI